MNKFKLISSFALTTSVLLWSTSSFAQSISGLSNQLQQAVEARNWSQAIQLIDRMIISEPSQAPRLKAYRTKLIELSTEIKQPVFSPSTAPSQPYRRQQKEYSFSFSDLGLVSDFYRSGNLIYLTGYFNNKSSWYVSRVKIYYKLLHDNFKERDSTGLIILSNIPAGKSQEIEELLPQGTYPSVDAILIRRIEWIDEDGNYRVDDVPRRLNPFSITPRMRKVK